MKKGERNILIGIALTAVVGMLWKGFQVSETKEQDYEIPFYSTASVPVTQRAAALIKDQGCKDCHVLWATRADMLKAVPAPSLDGIGSLRVEQWFFDYLSSRDPQAILPSRLKAEFRMPSYAHLNADDRRVLATYLAGLKVKDWYVEQARKAEYEKLTGKEYQP